MERLRREKPGENSVCWKRRRMREERMKKEEKYNDVDSERVHVRDTDKTERQNEQTKNVAS